MTLGYNTTLRNNRLSEIATLVDAGASAGLLRIYDGTRPATGGAVTTLLAELAFSDPAFGVPASGVLTANAINDDTSANADGTATWFRVVDSNGAFVYDGDVGLTSSGADLELASVAVSVGVRVSVTSLTITEGNP